MKTDSALAVEVGPIRPPNEAHSLLVRVTRNCPWNRCTFCPVYKGAPFSLRSVDEVQQEIFVMGELAARLATSGALPSDLGGAATQVALFLAAGGTTAFLQDANALITPVDDLVEVLQCLRATFPRIERVTTYARSHTVTKRSLADLVRLREAGLDRIHIGLESGSDAVLALVQKGVTAARHIEAGLRVKSAGIELSEYVMPGLGGRDLSDSHADETARVLCEIDPHFVRLRTLAIPPGSPIAEQRDRGELIPLDDVKTVAELRRMLGGFSGMTTSLRSDHILNLLEEIDGELPEDLPKMLAVLDRFIALPVREQEIFIVGRRLGLWRHLADLDRAGPRAHAEAALDELRRRFDRPDGPIDAAIRELMTRFV